MRKVAFLVANNTFPEDPDIPSLHFTQNDACELGEILADKEICGFETKLYLNQTSREVLADLEHISGELGSDDTILFYYAGHGRVRKDNQLYLYSKDTIIASLGATSIRARDVLTFLQESIARRRVLILDCCQSGAIGRDFGRFRGNDVESSLESLADSFGCYILTASTSIQLAEEREKDGHGVYTKALIDCLREGASERITITDLHAYADARLKISATQRPRLWTIEQEGAAIEIGNYQAKRERERREAFNQLIATARTRFDALQANGVLTQGQVDSILRLLECDEATLFPHDRAFRDNVIRYLKGEVEFVSVFARVLPPAPTPQPAPAPAPAPQPALPRTLTGHTNRVVSVAFSPDGRTLASGAGTSPSSSGTLRAASYCAR